MKFTYIIFITTCLTLCFGEEKNGKTVSSSYSYSIEYDDGEHGNFGHKIEVKDGSAKVNIRSENPQKFNSVRQTKSYLPQQPVNIEKPKQEITYVSAAATESSTVTPAGKNSLSYTAPQVSAPAPKNAAYNSALQKYSQEQLSVLLSQNKNPFLPLDPKDSISKFISKYISQQPNQVQQSYSGYNTQAQNTYQYQPQSYAQTPSVPTQSKSQYPVSSPVSYYTPSVPQQNQEGQQVYYQPQVQYSYPSSASDGHIQQNVASHIPQTQSVPQTQSAVQYVHVPQTSSQSSYAHLYGSPQTGPAQFSQQSYQPEAVKYAPSSGQQSGQISYSIPKIPSGQSYPSSLYSEYASSIPQTSVSGKQQYVTVPNSAAYQGNAAVYNTGSKIPSQTAQPAYQNAYASSSGNQYPGTVLSSSQYESAGYKPEALAQISAGNIDFSKYSQYMPAQSASAYVTSQGAVHSSGASQYSSAVPSSSGAYGQSVHTSGAPSVQDSSKSNIFGSNINFAHLFSGSQSLFSGGAGIKSSGNTQFTPSYGNNLIQGQQGHSQITNTGSSSNYKPVVEHPAPDTNAQVQYQPASVNSIFGSGNFDFSKYQFPGFNLGNSQGKYQIPSGSNIQLNQISNVQASDNKYGQYAIDYRQGANPSGAAQVMVHTNYNLGAQSLPSSHGSVPASAASDNSNVKYVYVPSYVPNTSQGHNQKQ